MSIEPEILALYAEQKIGQDAESFMNSDIGKTVLGLAQQQKDEAQEKLNKAPVYDRDLLRQLQNDIWRAESFAQWLTELFISGQQALNQLDSLHAESEE